MALDKKLTLADLKIPSGGGLLASPSDTVVALLSKGFWTCGVGCLDPHACLANEHCERGNPVADPKSGNACDAEFVAWYGGLDLLQKESRAAALKIAFNAGWAARKKADYEMIFGLDKSKAE